MANNKTESEERFEALCRASSIKFEPIPCRPGERTPDYMLTLGTQRVAAEVKQFDPNPEEAKANAARARGEVAVTGGVPGDRIRKAIHNGAPQRKRISEGWMPAVLVVYDHSGTNVHTDWYAVATAMQGLDVIDVAVFKEAAVPPQFGEPRSGPKKMMTATDNTTISALAVLGHNLDGALRLDLFHNRHAKNRLEPDLLRGPQLHHWRLPEGAPSSLVSWEAM